MKKLSREEMRNVKGGTSGNLWTCDGGFPFCHAGNPDLHTDPSCSDVVSCTMGASCNDPYACP